MTFTRMNWCWPQLQWPTERMISAASRDGCISRGHNLKLYFKCGGVVTIPTFGPIQLSRFRSLWGSHRVTQSIYQVDD